MKSVALAVALLASACTKKNPEACCTTQEDCDAIGLPIGSDCADDLVCIGNRCVATSTCQAPSDCPSATPQCNPEGVCVECLETSECGNQVCGADGQCVACVANDECDTGFCSEGVCRTSIVPKYLPNVCDVEADADLQLPAALDTDDGTACTQILSQGIGLPDICVIHARSIAVNGTVVATGGRALAIVADRSISVGGTLDASGNGSTPGPGASGTSGLPPVLDAGGGGAGFQTAGGNGGSTSDTRGPAVDDPAALSTLSGGFSAAGLGGGGGGGGVTLIACRGAISIAGMIDIGGGGGQGGTVSPVLAGRGGGSGGYLVLQGVTIEVTGQIFGNGGAGGGGSVIGNTNADGGAGEDGSLSTTVQAAGGVAGNSQIISGGEGGIVEDPPQSGAPRRSMSGVNITAGGGGGSMGFIQTYTPRGVVPQLQPATASPAFQPNLELSTK